MILEEGWEQCFSMIFEDNEQAWNLEENAILHLLQALGEFYSKINMSIQSGKANVS